MKHSFLGALKKGLFALAPLVITFALLRWVYNTLESIFDTIFETLIGHKFYFPGIGIVVALLLIVLVGYLLDLLLIQKLYNYSERLLSKIPLVKTLYGSIRQFMTFFKPDNQKKGQAVRVKVNGHIMLGIMTRKDMKNSSMAKNNEVAVFLPMSYQMGGYTVLVKKEDIEEITIPTEDVLKFAVTAGVLNEVRDQ